MAGKLHRRLGNRVKRYRRSGLTLHGIVRGDIAREVLPKWAIFCGRR